MYSYSDVHIDTVKTMNNEHTSDLVKFVFIFVTFNDVSSESSLCDTKSHCAMIFHIAAWWFL